MSDSASTGAFLSHRWAGLWLVVFTLLSWASVPLFLRDFASFGLDPFISNAWRYLISAVFWLPLLAIMWRRGQMPAGLVCASIVPVCFNIVGQTCFAWGPSLLDPGFFSFVFRVQIIFVTLGAYLLFPAERGLLRTRRYWLGVALVVMGSVGLFLFRDAGGAAPPMGQDVAAAAHKVAPGLTGDTRFWVGVGVSLMAGVMFAGYGLSVRYYVSKFSPVVSFGVICQFTAIGMVALGVTLGTAHGLTALDMTGPQWLKLVASAFIGIAVSHVSYYASLKRLGVSVTVGVIQLQPVLTAVGSTLIFDERLNSAQWAAGLLGVSGAIVMLWAGHIAASRQTKRAPTAPAATADGA
jgi:drug/metabolite transporter (DMT)-like permease